MSVEHRYCKRYPVDFILEYIYRGRRSKISRARNISKEGMLLKTPSLTPPRGMTVVLRFLLDGRRWEIPAVVVHSKPGQIGVMFQNPQNILCERVAATCAV